jgi:hypothetical protein
MTPTTMTLPTVPPTTTRPITGGPAAREGAASAAVARALLVAIVTRDHTRLRALLADDVWMRAMLVREVVEHHDADEVVARFQGWYGSAAALEVVRVEHDTAGTREAVAWRVRLRPPWAPEVWHLIEQRGYVRVRDGRVSRLDLVCTGFQPEHGPA